MLYKGKGERRDLGNYRGISAGSTLGKVFSQCMLYCLEGWATSNKLMSTLQRGFRCHRGCEDNLAALITALRLRRTAGPDRLRSARTHLVFVDFSKAYDRVPHAPLLQKLEALGIRGPMLGLIRETLKGNTTQIHTAHGLTAPVAVNRGLPQGHTLSPMLFAIYINDLLVELQTNKSATPVHSMADVGCLAYADDLVILADSHAQAQAQMETVRRWAHEWGMTVNLQRGKTEHMVFGQDDAPQQQLQYGLHTIVRTTSYKYLGVVFDSNDRLLRFPSMKKRMVRAAHGAHAAIMRLKVAAPDMPPGVLASIWQTWVLPQLMYGIGIWMDGVEWPEAEKFLHLCGRQLLEAAPGTPNAVVLAELGWRSVAFWIKYHRCRTLSRMLRAPADDLIQVALRDELHMFRARPLQAWLSDTIPIMSQSKLDSPNARRLQMYLQHRLQYVDFSARERASTELGAMDFEATWCNGILHEELQNWAEEASKGSTRITYQYFVSERRDRGADLDPKPRWATVTRPPLALRNVVGKADAKLLTSTRMGDRRSLSHKGNQATSVIGRNCPVCSSAVDSAPHMLQCPAIKQDLGVQEAFEQLKSSLRGRPIQCCGDGVHDPAVLVDFLAAPGFNMGAECVLLGNSAPSSVPANMRNLYRAITGDRQMHGLWLQGTVRIIRAAWACHGAAVTQKLQAAQTDLPQESPQPPHTHQDKLRALRDGVPLASQNSPRIANPDMGGMLTGEFVPDALHEHKEEEDEGPAMEYKGQEPEDEGQPGYQPLHRTRSLSPPRMPQLASLGALASQQHSEGCAISPPCTPQLTSLGALASQHSEEVWHTPEVHHSPTIQEQPALPQSMLSLSAGAPCTLLTMFCGQDVCSDVPDTGEQPHQEPQGDSEEGISAAGSSAGRVCAGVFVVEATPDTEVDVEASTAQDDEDDDGYGYASNTRCHA